MTEHPVDESVAPALLCLSPSVQGAECGLLESLCHPLPTSVVRDPTLVSPASSEARSQEPLEEVFRKP
jgi:hypothetical protein